MKIIFSVLVLYQNWVIFLDLIKIHAVPLGMMKIGSLSNSLTKLS